MEKLQKQFIGVIALVAVFFLSAAVGWGAIDPSTVQKLVAGDGAASDYFGWSSSIDGNTLVIGARGDDYSGSAYVFVRDESRKWIQQTKLLPDDGAVYDYFGKAVSISGDTIVIGAQGDDDNGDYFSGSAYIFTRNGDGSWYQKIKLVPDDVTTHSAFGCSVSISGDTIVIGSDRNHGNGYQSGSAYIFVRNGDGFWHQQAKLIPDASYSLFGSSVSISGNTVVIGSPGDDENGTEVGSVYVFVRNIAGVWNRQAKFLPDAGERFGSTVSISGDTVLISEPTNYHFGGDHSGSVYVFVRNGSDEWIQQTKLLPDDGTAEDHFGESVSISGDTIVIGASGDDDNGGLSGSAYIYSSIPT
ncbi:MAG: hypothetical protein D3915_14110, partial [Candidatus Electrothrix sp. AU1_5]|nr:hypothetical protein [Candidatus Electrothrix gigas]